MSNTGTSLWPTAVRPGVRTPHDILSAQAEALAQQTDGVLVGELSVRESEGGPTTLTLDICAPALDYRHWVLTASHLTGLSYPASVDALIFRPQTPAEAAKLIGSALLGQPRSLSEENVAASDEALTQLVRRVLNSPQVVAVAVSLIARAEDATRDDDEAAEADGDGMDEPTCDETAPTAEPAA